MLELMRPCETGERAGFDRADGVHETGRAGQSGNVRVTQEFEAAPGKVLPEGGEHGQGENKITDGTPADDQDFIFGHGSAVD